MIRRAALTHAAIVALVVALALIAAPAPSSADAHPGHETVDVDIRVWQHVQDPLGIHISARPEGVRWDALGTIRLHLDDGLSSDRRYRFGDVTVEGVEVRVWQRVTQPLRIHISARPVGGDWGVLGTIRLLLDDGHSTSGNYRYGDITVAVPLAPGGPPVVVSPGGEEVPRLAILTIAFREPPGVSDGADVVSIAPPVEGSFVWADARTLLFQPNYPGWQRGQQYTVVVDGPAAGLTADQTHTFTVEGGLEVAHVIPGDGDTEVPAAAQIFVQFNRSVAALTVLQEGPAAALLEFDPPLEGTGEWLNTSLYRFLPTNLQPSTTYSVRSPAGMTSAADGVLDADFAWTFSTIQPDATRFEPADEATHVEPDGTVAVTFNQPMDRESVQAGLVLRSGVGEAVASSFEWSEDGTVVTVQPDAPLLLDTEYEVVAPAGLRGVNAGEMRSERASTFRVTALPRLIRTHPADGSTDASRYGIELVYNNPMDVDSFEGRVSISGIDPEDIEIRSYRWQPTSISIAPFEHSTEYTVRIAEGVSDRGGRTVAAAHEFSFTTRPPSPSLSLAAPSSLSTLSSSGEQVLYYHAARLDEVRFRLYQLSDDETETVLRRGEWYYGDAFWPEAEPLREWSEAIAEDQRDASRLYSTPLGDGGALAKGHYLLVADYEGIYRPLKLMVSVVDTAIVTKQAFDEMLVWALDYDTGEPLDATSVRTVPLSSRLQTPYRMAPTDADGLARFAFPVEDRRWRGYNDHLVRIDAEGRLGVASTSGDSGVSLWSLGVNRVTTGPGWTAHLYTDRPIYRPGETVYFKAAVRPGVDSSYSLPPADTTLVVTVRDSRYETVDSRRVALSGLGTLTGDYVLPTDAPTGTYSVSVGLDSIRGGFRSTSFTVAEFRVPEFEVELETAEGDYVDGDTVPAEAQATFFFGAPVPDSAVEWTAQSIPTEIRVEGYEDYSFTERDYYWRWYGSFSFDLRSRGNTTTDGEGLARFEVPATLEEDEGTQEFTISATVTDANAQSISGSARVLVHPATWYAGIKPESYIGRAGEPATVHLVTVDFERRIAPDRPVTVRLYEREWVRIKERAAHGGYRYRSEPKDTEIDVQMVTTNADGEASIEVTPPSAGTYRIVAESTDDEGRVARSARFIWVSGSDHVPWPVREDNTFELIAGRETYEVGDVAEVLVPAPFAGATGLVTIERGGIHSTEVRRFETNSEVLRIPIEDRHIPNIYVGVVLYRPPTEDDPYPRYDVGYVDLSISTEPRRLDVSIKPDRDTATPGETVGYEVQVTDSEGNPVEADVSVAVVDQAVLSLRDEVGGDGMAAFWSERGLGVRTASSLGVSIDRWNESFRETEEGERGEGSAGDGSSGGLEMADSDGAISEQAAFVGESGGDDTAFRASPGPEPAVRSNFQNTALWIGQLTTDANGRATFDLDLPDNATTWRALARAITAGTQVGEGESALLVTQPLLVRPALPRFLRVGDEVILRTLVRNGTDEARDVTVTIEAEGVVLDDDAAHMQRVEPGESIVVGWPARPVDAGTATVRFRATASGGFADAVELTRPVYLDVTPETTATGGVVEDTPALEAVYLPDYVITGSGSLELALKASLVGALDEELPHFRPYRWESNVRIASRIVATIAVGRATAGGLTEGQEGQLIRDIRELVGNQHYLGGWDWCNCNLRPNVWVTAWVLIAFGEARDEGYTVEDYSYERAMRYVTEHMANLDANPNLRAFLLYALTSAANEGGVVSPLAREQVAPLRTLADEHRTELTSWGRAYLLLALIASGHEPDHEAVRILLNDLAATTIPSANGSHWEDEPTWGSMHNTSVRATALVLRALVEAEPQHPLIEETTRWLVVARSAERWKTSVERAQAMASLGAFAQLTGENRGVYDYQVLLNTTRVLSGHFDAPARDYTDGVALTLDALPLGEVSRLQFEREAGTEGRLYYALNLRYVTPAKDIEALNRGFAVSHSYSLLEDPETPITGASLGDVVRVTVTVVAPADRVFARVEDFLPAGLEPIDPRLNIVSPWLREQLRNDQTTALLGGAPSWYAPWFAWYYSPWDQVDLRDDRVTLRAALLPRGVHEYVYFARATTPGDFFVAPAHAEETYFPDVFGRSDSSRFTVSDAE